MSKQEKFAILLTLSQRYVYGFLQRIKRAYGVKPDVDEQFAIRMDSTLVQNVTILMYQLYKIDRASVIIMIRENKDTFYDICMFLREIKLNVEAMQFESCFDEIVKLPKDGSGRRFM